MIWRAELGNNKLGRIKCKKRKRKRVKQTTQKKESMAMAH